MYAILGVFVGGGFGSILRYMLAGRIGNHWGIMVVNLLGAFLIGLVYESLVKKVNINPEMRAFLITGMLGGFTTFSTYMLDFGLLVNNQKVLEALIYLVGSLALGIVFLYLGMLLGKAWLF